MDVHVDPALASAVHSQLVHQNLSNVKSFVDIVTDYLDCLQRARELQVRCTQLDKEAGELRLENDTLIQAVAEGRQAAVRGEEYAALEARLSAVQGELTSAYRDKSSLAEASLAATKQLQVVRDLNERQAAELDAAQAEVRALRGAVAALTAEADHQRQAQALSGREMEARLAEAEAATRRAAQLESENTDLVTRLVEEKGREIEKMNEMNRREEMLTMARREASAMLAEARSRLAQATRPSEGAEILEASLRSLALGAGGPADEAAPLPACVAHCAAAHAGGCFGLAFTRDGSLLASGGADKTVKLWEPATGALNATLQGAFEGINGVAFTCDQRLVLGADSRRAVRVWDVATGRLRLSLTGHADKVMGLDCSPASPATVVSCSSDRTIKVWGLEKGFCQRTLMCHSSCNSVAITQDGAMVASGHFDGTLRFWDLRSARATPSCEVAGLHSGQITSVAAGLAGGLLLTCGKDNQLRTVGVQGCDVRQTLSAPAFSLGGVWTTACLSPNEKHAAAGSADGTVFVWDVERRTVGARLKDLKHHHHHHSVVACAWSPIGLPLVSCDKSGSLTFWQAALPGRIR